MCWFVTGIDLRNECAESAQMPGAHFLYASLNDISCSLPVSRPRSRYMVGLTSFYVALQQS